jgi:hypothetical protein
MHFFPTSFLKLLNFHVEFVTGPEGASAIADAVTLHRSIHSLFLSSNNIGSDGAVSIARIVMASTSLTALNLKSNRIGSEGTQRYFASQSLACSLFQIFSNLCRVSIAASLSRNNHLISLDLWNNDVGERGAGAISEALSINTTLQELDLGSNAILDSGFLVVVNALGSSSLVKLLCRVNQIGTPSAVFRIELTFMAHQVYWVCKGSLPQYLSCIAYANCTCGATISLPAGVKLPRFLRLRKCALLLI